MRNGKAEALMKGSLHTDEIMGEVVKRDTGLRTARRISHCFVMDVPSYEYAVIISDAAVNIAPTLRKDKIDIVQNAIDRARAGSVEVRSHPVGDGDGEPRRAFDDRGGGAVQDGRPRPDHRRHPRRPARARQRDQPRGRRHQEDQVAGRGPRQRADRAGPRGGNMLAKSLSFLANADSAGIVLGAKVPIMLTSRADSVMARLASCAVASLVAQQRRDTAAKAIAA